MRRILITDGEQRAALAAARCLGRHFEVHVAASESRCLAGVSRFTKASHCLPDPAAEPGPFGAALVERVRSLQPAALLPVTDAATSAALRVREDLAPCALAAPAEEAYRALSDKQHVAALARRHGIPPPEGAHAGGFDEALEAAEKLGWPVIVKPTRSLVTDAEGRLRKTRVFRAGDPEALRLAWDEAVCGAPALVQRAVPGYGEGVFVLRWQGLTRAAFAHRRLREKPPGGGVSVLRESIPVDPDLLARIEAILDEVGFEGVAMAELRTDGRERWLMEFNARLWGSLQLAIDAGVDFPRLLLDAVLGEPPARFPDYRTGVRSRWLLGDLDHAIALARGGTDARGRSGVAAALSVLLRPAGPGCRWEILRARDPRPFGHALARWLRGAAA